MKIKSEKAATMLTFFNELFSLIFFYYVALFRGLFAQWKEFVSNVNVPKSIHSIEMCEHIERKYKNIFILQTKNCIVSNFYLFLYEKVIFQARLIAYSICLLIQFHTLMGSSLQFAFKNLYFFLIHAKKYFFVTQISQNSFLSALKSAHKLSRHRF
jgi:hypothetical protein